MLQPLLAALAKRLDDGASEAVLGWNREPSAQTCELLHVPGSRIEWTEATGTGTAGHRRLRLQVFALDQDWRERVTLNTEIPATLLPALEWVAQRKQAFGLGDLERHTPQIGLIDVRQLLDLLVKAHAFRLLVPR